MAEHMCVRGVDVLSAEDEVRHSGVPAAIVRPCALTEEPRGMPIQLDQGDTIKVSSPSLCMLAPITNGRGAVFVLDGWHYGCPTLKLAGGHLSAGEARHYALAAYLSNSGPLLYLCCCMQGKIGREDVAELVVALLSQPAATDVTFEIKSTVPFSQPWQVSKHTGSCTLTLVGILSLPACLSGH
jgi:hypothetical protein